MSRAGSTQEELEGSLKRMVTVGSYTTEMHHLGHLAANIAVCQLNTSSPQGRCTKAHLLIMQDCGLKPATYYCSSECARAPSMSSVARRVERLWHALHVTHFLTSRGEVQIAKLCVQSSSIRQAGVV